MRKKQLAIKLSRLLTSSNPHLEWESYYLDSESAAEIVYFAACIQNDVSSKNIVDLGCGCGILAIAASFLGASWVVGVDIDNRAIQIAKMNSEKSKCKIDFISSDINCIRGHFDTTLMNPPFGSRIRGADVKFLTKALEISDIVYSLHKDSMKVQNYLEGKIPKIGGRIDKIKKFRITIPRIYSFHKKSKYSIDVSLYRIIGTIYN